MSDVETSDVDISDVDISDVKISKGLSKGAIAAIVIVVIIIVGTAVALGVVFGTTKSATPPASANSANTPAVTPAATPAPATSNPNIIPIGTASGTIRLGPNKDVISAVQWKCVDNIDPILTAPIGRYNNEIVCMAKTGDPTNCQWGTCQNGKVPDNAVWNSALSCGPDNDFAKDGNRWCPAIRSKLNNVTLPGTLTFPASSPNISGISWKCFDDIIPFMDTPLGRYNNEYACLSSDGLSCKFGFCSQGKVTAIPSVVKPLSCGPDSGLSKYDKDHFCGIIRDALPPKV